MVLENHILIWRKRGLGEAEWIKLETHATAILRKLHIVEFLK